MFQTWIPSSPGGMDTTMGILSRHLLNRPPVTRGEWQAQKYSDPAFSTHEDANVIVQYQASRGIKQEQDNLRPDLPWAEDHFQERVGGLPLNPAPSFMWWPYHKGNENKHTDENNQFDHTYPERYWPKYAGEHRMDPTWSEPNKGVRFDYGDLSDVVNQLSENSWTRQAYLPVWFPEDTGATVGQRVPCTLGYHFIRNKQFLDCNYYIRSCDMTRHFRNDVYMTVRLMQWVLERMDRKDEYPLIGTMTMFISNLHIFKGDAWRFDVR